MLAERQSGVTVVELMIGVAIVAVLMTVAMPSFSQWMQNMQIRTAADSIQNGLQLARAEAVHTNSPVAFQLTSATGRVDWTVCNVLTQPCPQANIVQARGSGEGSPNARVGVGTTATPFATPIVGMATNNIVFTGMGRITPPLAAGVRTRLDIWNANSAAARRLVLLISSGGSVRMCDPALPQATNAQGCS
jgi:type IV fimbrial biogenesis protein FimT